METFTELKKLEENPHFQAQKEKTARGFTDEMIDMPIRNLIKGFNKLSYCFTLQSCYGHFLWNDQSDKYNIEPLPDAASVGEVKYRIAYIVFCIENCRMGKELIESLLEITAVDSENVQFCCADWFWNTQVNSYALQVEPDRFKHKDTATVDFKEAIHLEKLRNDVFIRLNKLLETIKMKSENKTL
jgi:hypothetical protein